MQDRDAIVSEGPSGVLIAAIVVVLLTALFGYFLFVNRPDAPPVINVDPPKPSAAAAGEAGVR